MNYDVVVVGTGIAGCAAAIAASDAGADVLLLTKASRPEESSTNYAQGGIAVVGPGDSSEAFVRDIVAASAGRGDEEAARRLVAEGPRAVEEVLVRRVGVAFDRDFALEAAHGARRVLHARDETGRAIEHALVAYVADETPVTVMPATAALDLVTASGRVAGVVAMGTDGRSGPQAIGAGAVVLATGGVGDLYEVTTNPPGMSGDGIAMGLRAGAAARDLEFVQFHPTVHVGPGPERPFLLTEALRGEGATVVDRAGHRFLFRHDPRGELAPRYLVAQAIEETRRTGGEVFLDLSPLRERGIDLASRFPQVTGGLAARGLDVEKDPRVPVRAAEHFLCGGLAVDALGATGVPGLYAAGETAATGVHGANRLASTSLLEGLVWGLAAGRAASEEARRHPPRAREVPHADIDEPLPEGFLAPKWDRLRRLLWKDVGVLRTQVGLSEATSGLLQLRGEVESFAHGRLEADLWSLKNACTVGLLIARAAKENPTSLGCHRILSP
ncbi:MAG: L-aspartate oxidase [Methanobacteriota archaeon]